MALTGEGESLMLAGRPGEAVAPLDRAYAIREAGNDPLERGETRFALARALWDGGRDRARAHRLADGARADFRSVEAGKDEAAQVEAWLGTHVLDGS